MYCPECGIELPDNSKFCVSCGHNLKKITTPPEEWSPSPDPFPDETYVKEPEPATQYLKEGSLFANQFEILSKGIPGGMGIVYKCRHTKLNKTIALKVIHPRLLESEQAIEKFRNEVAISQDLRDPKNIIVTVYDIGEWQGKEYFTMEWIEGVTLREIIEVRKKEEMPFSIDEADKIISQLSEALQYAHNHRDKILHRDIKPENIMVTDKTELSIKLTDFGIAKMLNQSGFQYISGKQTGTAYYMAPEQRSFTGEIDTRADIYSVGVVLFELLTLRNTIGFKLPSDLNKELPKEIDNILKRTLEEDPEDRYDDIEELSGELNKISSKERGKKEEKEREEAERRQKIALLLKEGNDFLENNNFDRAIDTFETLLKIEPDYAKGKVLLAKAQKQKEREEERKRREAERQERIASLLKAGKSCLEKKEYEQAIQAFESLVEIELEHDEGKTLLSKAHQEKREEEERQEKIASLIKEGRNYFEEGKFNDAVETFESILKIDSEHREGNQLLLIKARGEQKRFEEEAKEAEKRREVNSLLDKGKRYIEEKAYDQAIETFENLIKIDAEHEEGKNLLTLARERKNEEEVQIRERYEREEEQKNSKTTIWSNRFFRAFLTNTFIWLPSLLLLLASGLGVIPVSENKQFIYLRISWSVVIPLWLLTWALSSSIKTFIDDFLGLIIFLAALSNFFLALIVAINALMGVVTFSFFAIVIPVVYYMILYFFGCVMDYGSCRFSDTGVSLPFILFVAWNGFLLWSLFAGGWRFLK